jgi:lysophospholipase L1-like esterase
MSFTKEERLVYRTFATVVVLLSFAFLVLRDALLRRLPRVRGKGLMRGFLVPPLYVFFIVVCFVLLVILFDRVQIRTEPTLELERPSQGLSPRIAVLGGSSTRGYPFPPLWGASYPMVLERLLDHDGAHAMVWNLGVESATLSYLSERFERWVGPLAPTHVVINNVANNAFGDPAPFRDGLTRVVDLALRHASHVILIKEPMLEMIYHAGRWASVGPFYPVLDEVAIEPGVTVLDPNPMLIEHRDELLFMDDVHLTPQGHRRMAEALAEKLHALHAASTVSVAPSAATP